MNNEKMQAYILEAIDPTPYVGEHTMSDVEKLTFLKETYMNEYGKFAVKQHKFNHQLCFAEWVAGLPTVFNIDFQNFDIWNKAVELEMIAPDPTDEAIDAVLETWFTTVTAQTFKLFKKHKII
jgi:hypothetical protein